MQRASRKHPQLQYLYLGYYIPNNDKMMYKVRSPCCLYLVAARLCSCEVALGVQWCLIRLSDNVVPSRYSGSNLRFTLCRRSFSPRICCAPWPTAGCLTNECVPQCWPAQCTLASQQ